jgi:hypothetical protein
MKTVKIVLAALVLLAAATSCKKSTTQPQAQTQPGQGGTVKPDSVQYSFTVTSNFLRSYVGVDNLTDNVAVRRWNVAGDVTNCPITFTFWARANKHYYINTYSTKNTTDSTLYMTDNKHVWNKLVISTGGAVVYSKKDSIGSGAWPITINNYHINP